MPSSARPTRKGLLNPGKMIAWENPDYDYRTGKTFPVQGAAEGGLMSLAMRVLVLYAHPVETSFNARSAPDDRRATARRGPCGRRLRSLCRGFRSAADAGRAARLSRCRGQLSTRSRAYVERLLQAEALVLSFPVWNFGYPAILKGFFDRVFLPGRVVQSWSTARCSRRCTISARSRP